MIVENPLALSYILPGDVYLLAGDKLTAAAGEPVKYDEQPELEVPVVRVPSARDTEPVQPAPIPEPVAALAPVPAIPKITAAPAVADDAVSPGASKPVPRESPAKFEYKGGNQKRFLVIVHYPDQELMEPAHLVALENAITRRGLTLDDTAIFNIGKYPGTPLKAIGMFFRPQKMLLLGTGSFPEGLLEAYPLQLNTPGKVGKCEALYSYSFNEMMGNKEKTKAFWEQMKSL